MGISSTLHEDPPHLCLPDRPRGSCSPKEQSSGIACPKRSSLPFLPSVFLALNLGSLLANICYTKLCPCPRHRQSTLTHLLVPLALSDRIVLLVFLASSISSLKNFVHIDGTRATSTVHLRVPVCLSLRAHAWASSQQKHPIGSVLASVILLPACSGFLLACRAA